MKLRCLLLPLLFAALLPHVCPAQQILPGAVWNDDRGKPIQAHGGGITQVGKTFYWYGEDRSPENDPGKRYVSCYSSQDLVHWHFEANALALSDPEQLGSKWVLERPKVFYNRSSKNFVMYMHLDAPGPTGHGYTFAKVGVAVSKSAAGPFHYLRSFRPLGLESRDIGQFVDEDGSASLIFESRPSHGFLSQSFRTTS